jgi:CTP:molybdopterin cytidylyltransferase MocA
MTGTLSAEHRRLTHAVASASDDQLARVVAMFDRMPDRREADRLLDAARPRLRRLRPPRPIAFTRLLFLPLDGVVVEARGWKRADGSLPRSALVALADAVRVAIGSEAGAIEAGFAGRSFADLAAVDAAGRRLWRAAARVAEGLAPSPAWEGTGLAEQDFRHCTGLAAGVWRHADPLWTALLAAREGPPEVLVQAALTSAAAEPPLVSEAMLATLLTKAAKPGSVAAAAAATRVGPPGAADRVLDRWIEECRPDLTVSDPQGAAQLAEEFAEALGDLETCPAGRRPERRQRVAALKRQVGEACRAAFAESATHHLIEPLAKAAAPLDDAGMAAMEATARSLRRLEHAGRALGGARAYDAALRRVTDAFVALRDQPQASAADLARLTEILAGPEAALKLLDGA